MKIITTTIVLLLSMIADSVVIAAPAEREHLKKECMENLRAIGKAIIAYRNDHNGEMPDWISELYPKYLQAPKILICPVDKTGGSPAIYTAYKDPKMPCSYLYEFNPMKFLQEGGYYEGCLFDINPPKNLTFKERKTIELKYFGNTLPVVHCCHHSHGGIRHILNLGYDGEISISSYPGKWPNQRLSLISFLQNAIEHNPDSWEKELSTKEIYNYFKERNWLLDFRAILEKQSNLSVDVLKILGEIYLSEGNIDEAIKIYNRLVRLHPDDTDFLFQLAKLYAMSKNYREAREQCRRIIQLKHDYAEVNGILSELDAIADGRRIQERYSKTPGGEMHYFVKLEELLLAKKDLKPTVRKAHDIAQDSFGKPTTVKKLSHLYRTLDKSFGEAKGQWQTYNNSDGLVNNWVASMAQDERGILWIGTGAGVCQYNGESFTRFTINEEFDNNGIPSILIDKQGHIWFGGWSHGIVVYDGESFVHYTTENGLAGNNVRDIFQDSHGAIWVACLGGGISRYDGKSSSKFSSQFDENRFTNFTTEDGLAANEVHKIIEDSRGVLWIGTSNGVSKYEKPLRPGFDTASPTQPKSPTQSGAASLRDGKTFTTPTLASGLAGNTVSAIAEDQEGNLWFGANKGASRFDGEKFTSFTKKDGLTDAEISRILTDREGNLWFAVAWWIREGVFRYDGKTFINLTTRDGLAGNSVSTVFEDREGNLWFGDDTGRGLSKFNPRGLKNYGVEDGLANALVLRIVEDKEGNLWVAHSDRGVSKYDGVTFTQPIAEDERVLGNIYAILVDSKNNLWFGTCTHGDNSACGVVRFDGTDYTRFTTLDGLVWNQIFAIIEDRNGNIWMGAGSAEGSGEGISRYDGKNFTNFTMADGLGYDDVTCLNEDHQGNIWIGTWAGGISRYEPLLRSSDSLRDGTQFTNFTTDDGLVSDYVNSIFTDSRGRIWIGTFNGLSMYDGASFTTLPQFAGNNIMSITEEKKGYLWFGMSETGVIKTDGEVLTHITTSDGLPNNSVPALREDKDGNIWIGTGEGLTKYTPNPVAPLIHIESVVADKVYTNPNVISIPAGKNVRINYRGISFRTRPEAMQYFYQLQGHDDDWQGPTNKRNVDYLNLKPGTDTFEVKAVDIDLNYSQPASVTLKVMPPFYKRFVFIAPASLGVLLMLLILFYQRRTIAKLTKRLFSAEEKVKQTQAQLIQSEKMATVGTLAGGVAHEINNPLDATLGSVQRILRFPEDPKRVVESAQSAQEGTRRCKDIVEKLLKYARQSSDEFTSLEVNQVIEDTVALLAHQLKLENISLEMQLSPGLNVQGNFTELSQVITNVLTNARDAIVAARATGKDAGAIAVRTAAEKDEVLIEVTDNGIGIDEEHLGKLFDPFFTTKPVGKGTGLGLSICQGIIEKHHGRIEASSEVGKGATFRVFLPSAES